MADDENLDISTLGPQPSTLDPLNTDSVSVDLRTDIHLAGINSALQRIPRVETELTPLLKTVPMVVSWRPTKPKIQTYGITFPEAVSLLPPKEPKPEKLEKIQPPQVVELPGEEASANRKRQVTKL